MTQIFETIMLVCFGISWPISVVKSIKSKSAKGKSLVFTVAIIIGYCAGIAGKICSGTINYVFGLYVLNLSVVTLDLIISIINAKRDAKNEATAKQQANEVAEAKAETSSAKPEQNDENRIPSVKKGTVKA